MQCLVKGTLQGRLQILKSSLRNFLQPQDLICGKQNLICSSVNVIPICHCYSRISAKLLTDSLVIYEFVPHTQFVVQTAMNINVSSCLVSHMGTRM
jgi:hypothetical protein